MHKLDKLGQTCRQFFSCVGTKLAEMRENYCKQSKMYGLLMTRGYRQLWHTANRCYNNVVFLHGRKLSSWKSYSALLWTKTSCNLCIHRMTHLCVCVAICHVICIHNIFCVMSRFPWSNMTSVGKRTELAVPKLQILFYSAQQIL